MPESARQLLPKGFGADGSAAECPIRDAETQHERQENRARQLVCPSHQCSPFQPIASGFAVASARKYHSFSAKACVGAFRHINSKDAPSRNRREYRCAPKRQLCFSSANQMNWNCSVCLVCSADTESPNDRWVLILVAASRPEHVGQGIERYAKSCCRDTALSRFLIRSANHGQ